MKDLEKFIKSNFDQDGFPFSRNPNDLIFLMKYLLLCSESIKDAEQYVPEYLRDIIKKGFACINLMKTPNDSIPLFNGGLETNLNNFDKYIENFKINKKNKKNIVGGILCARTKNQIFYMDVEGPPEKSFSNNYQSGPLSFEYYLDGMKIITNCGFGSNISSKAELISRFTASQSTLTINDTAITKFERNKLINRVFGNSIKNTFKTIDLDFKDNNSYIGCSIKHDGYEKNFKCIHKREIYIDKINNKLSGIDHIFKRNDGIPIRYVFRFHLNPSLTAVKTMSGNSALIQISRNKSVLFSVKEESLEVEKSIFLGGKKILDNTCITISGNLVNKDKSFNWEIKKKI